MSSRKIIRVKSNDTKHYLNAVSYRNVPPLQPETWYVHFYPIDDRLVTKERLNRNIVNTHYPLHGRIPNTAPNAIYNVDGASPEDRQRVMLLIQDKALQMAEYFGCPFTWEIKHE